MKGYLSILITLLMFGCGRRSNSIQISYLQNDTLTEEPEILISADRQKDSIVYIPYDSIFANLYNSKMWNCKEMSGEAPNYIDSLNLDWYSLNLLMKNRLYPQAKELYVILPDSTTFNVIQKPRYNDIHYIDTMLMLSYCGGYDVVPAFQRELEKYLSLPITFKTKLPMFENSQGCNSEGGLFDKSNNGIYVLYTPDKKYKIYISALTVLNMDRYNRISTTDTRLIRRIVRDYQFRSYSAIHTLNTWHQVTDGEEKNIFPFQEDADRIFNTSLIYELGALKPIAMPLLKEIKRDNVEYTEAQRLINILKYFREIPAEYVPDNSLLKEFIGGGTFGLH